MALTLRPAIGEEHRTAEVVTGRFYKEDTYGFVGQSRRQVSVLNLDENELEWTSELAHGASLPTWSPDGERLAVRVGSAAGFPWGTVAILDQATGGVISILEPWQGTVEAITFYGEDSIVFVGSEGPWTQQTDVHVWNWRTNELRSVSHDLPWQIWVYGFHVSPSPLSYLDDHSLLLAGVADGSSGLYSFDLRSGNWQRLHSSHGVRGGLAYSSRLAVVVQEMSEVSTMGGLSAVSLPLSSERVLVSANEDFFEKYGELVVDRYSIPSDGEQIDAWLLHEPGTSLSSAPLVLDIHGGPHNFYGEFFLAEHQLLARSGFLVLYCNPRGSGSYSREFAAATLTGQWGTADSGDIMTVLHSVRGQLGHRGQVAVSGWSYGGYQVLTLLQRYPELFAAGVCGAPASDFLSWYGTSDAGPTFAAGELGGLPAERTELYADGSPSRHLDAVRAPLLLLHGLQDMRSPIAQTEIVHRMLSDAGKVVRYVRYPGASHGFRNTGRPSQRRHVLQELACWLSTHLQVAAAPEVEKPVAS
ncbi:MAG: alpha/beta fold hydrolase [Actinomycetota bacterium]|nr:alpha/beta fold hydrolase [Actinomycetota bacterium]